MESSNNQLFIEYLNKLKKEFKVMNSSVAQQIGVSKDRVFRIKNGSDVTNAELKSVINLYEKLNYPSQSVNKDQEIANLYKNIWDLQKKVHELELKQSELIRKQSE